MHHFALPTGFSNPSRRTRPANTIVGWRMLFFVLSYPPMRRIAGFSSLVCCLASCLVCPSRFVAAQSKPADTFANEALVFEKLDTVYRMHADGTGEHDTHVVARVQSQGAAQQLGVLVVSYASAYETPHIALVRVHKKDGSTVDTPASDAVEMSAAVSREAPLYSDLKEKHIPVRSLSVGDTLEYDVHFSIDKAEAPGQFWGVYHFTAPGTGIVLSETLTVETPVAKYAQVWSPNHKPTISDHDGLRAYHWDLAQLVPAPKNTGDDAAKSPAPKDPDEDADGRKIPSVAWTTFHSWAEVGEWYRGLAAPQATPNDALRAKADELTKDAKTPEDQVRALYRFVSTGTRYVGIDFGVGRYQPHTAAEVFANQYGDCKDKDTLLEALLHAKGFSTAPALIGAGIAPVADVPSPAVFNHVITTVDLPGGRIWLDATPPVAPYRYLGAIIRDQKALVVPANAPAALEATPANAPYPFEAHFEATATLDAEGKLTGKITASYRDDDEVLVRAFAQTVAPAQWDQASQYISSNTGFGGTTSDTQFANASDYTVPIQVNYTYSRHPYGDWDDRRIVPLLPALEFSALDSDSKAPEEDIQLGAPRTLTAICHIKLPDGYRTDLPDPIHVKTSFATFDKTYKFDGKEIVVERKIVVLRNKLPKSDWKDYQSFTRNISLSGEPWIRLIQPPKTMSITIAKSDNTVGKANPGKTSADEPAIAADPNNKDKKVIFVKHLPAESASATTPATPGAADAKPGAPSTASSDDTPIPELMNQVRAAFRSGDWGGVKELLDKIKAKNPEEEYLWSSYGFLAQAQRNNDEAIADFRKELTLHPDNASAAGGLAEVQTRSGDALAARHTLQEFLASHSGNLRLSMYLVSLENKAQDYAGALKTLEPLADQNPNNRSIRLQISTELLHLKRNDEAAAAAKSVLDGTDDPTLLNNAAFELSETGLDLPTAENASRQSITRLEEKSSQMTTAQANSQAFADANMLVASWDTLGWILYREGKLDQAKDYLSAAWHASLLADVGDHLAQVYEATGDKNAAATTYALARTACNSNTEPEVHTHIETSIDRLHSAGARETAATGAEALQSLRTYKLPRPASAKGWGTFRLEVTSSGVIESQQMSGEHQLTDVKKSIDAMKFSELLPQGSKAHLLRSAVVSCSMGPACELVLVPDGGLRTEQQ
jgi:tetratricopeptide (TPR) repeat protein/transglutaminase-like putative cysteine protease